MPPINILIKPASSACNMSCKYCFYDSIAQNREVAFEGMLSVEKLEQIVKSAFEYAEGYCGFTFQGGEPTLRGLDFYSKLIELQKKYNKKGINIHNSIQTNGYLIDERWAKFFYENKFLVGISVDGYSEIHNLNRKDKDGKDTFNKVIKSCKVLEKHKVDFNILSVVTGQSSKKIEKSYNFFKKNGFKYLQFIPCLEPIEKQRGNEEYHLSVENYSNFLKKIFDLWYSDFIEDNYISIRHIDNIISIVMGERPEACTMQGCCSIQFVVEGDGGVYPCDFYVFDDLRMGTIGKDTFEEMRNSSVAKNFLDESIEIPEECKKCNVYYLCRNGCKRDRTIQDGENKNYYCRAYKDFYNYAHNRINEVSNNIRNRRLLNIK